MIKYILILFALSFSVIAREGAYSEIGLSVHARGADAPEFNSPNPLGNIGGGYTFEWQHNKEVDIYFRHTSSLPQIEEGYGFNQIGINIRIYSD